MNIYTDADGVLTPDGTAFLEAWFANWPKPSRLLRTRYPDLYRTAMERGRDPDELDGICNLAAVEALSKFRPGVASFTTYVGWRFRAAVQRDLGFTGKRSDRHRPLRKGHFRGDLADHRPTEIAERERGEWRDAIRRKVAAALVECTAAAVRRCPTSRQRELFARRHGLIDGVGHTYAETAKAFGVTAQLVHHFDRTILPKMKEALAGVGRDM